MSQETLMTIALSLVATFFGLLMLVLGWSAQKLYGKVDEISKNLLTMASELHERITGIDLRLTRVETVSDMKEGNLNRRDSDHGH